MKQKKLMGLALTSLLILSGCSSTVKDDGKDVIASIDGKNVLANDVYDSLAESTAGENALFSYVLDQLVTAHFPVTSDMKDNASDIIKNIKANYSSQYGDNADAQLESALSSSGYETIDDYEDSLVYSLQYSEFIKKYVKENYDKVFEDYYTTESPRYLSLIKVSMSDVDAPTEDEQAKLNEVKSLLKTDKSFADIASEYSDDSTNSAKGNLGIIDSTSALSDSYGSDVEKAALALEEGKTSDAIKGEDGYYFLYCSSTSKDAIKKELESVDIDSPLLVYDSYIVYLAFNTYDIKYGNDDIKEKIETIVKEALKTRDEQRGGQS